jgi:hypothetical protein
LETDAASQLSYCPLCEDRSARIDENPPPQRPELVRLRWEHMFAMKLRPQADYELATRLIGKGHGDSEIARLTGIPRPTISAWRHGRGSAYHARLAMASSSWRPEDARTYCYLLGVYLGDGCIQALRGTGARLVISLDLAYREIIATVEQALRTLLPDVRVTRSSVKDARLTVIGVSHPVLPFAFPQHGAGLKHTREIRLTDWQRDLTRHYPKDLLRGLIHSDGCRTINRFTTRLPSGRVAEYEYPRYFFSNLSADIRRIFCEHCDVLGIRWTQSNPRNISVSHRRSVALLDEFVGPKA